MYKLPYFTEEDPKKVIAFMKENYFAVITGMGKEYPVVTHIPLEIIETNGELKFTGHLMKHTDHHHAFRDNENVLVVFNGPHCYISASWYPKQDVASTWNYMSVHAKGKIRFIDEPATYEAIKNITDKHEAPGSPAGFDKLPKEYVAKLVKAIIAFEIRVESFDNVFKLSQNHDQQTRKNIIEQLTRIGSDNTEMIAKEMTKRLEQ